MKTIENWVDCPICGEPDMHQDTDAEGNNHIQCTNHACASNGGPNASRVIREKGDDYLRHELRAIEIACIALGVKLLHRDDGSFARATLQDEECICTGNWRAIVKESEHLLDKRFVTDDGKVWSLFGFIHGEDDYYYGMWRIGEKESSEPRLRMLSCVGSLEAHGFHLKDKEA